MDYSKPNTPHGCMERRKLWAHRAGLIWENFGGFIKWPLKISAGLIAAVGLRDGEAMNEIAYAPVGYLLSWSMSYVQPVGGFQYGLYVERKDEGGAR